MNCRIFSIWSWSAPPTRKTNWAYADRSTAPRVISPPAWKGLLNASVLDLAMIVLSRSKNAAVGRAMRPSHGIVGAGTGSAAGSDGRPAETSSTAGRGRAGFHSRAASRRRRAVVRATGRQALGRHERSARSSPPTTGPARRGAAPRRGRRRRRRVAAGPGDQALAAGPRRRRCSSAPTWRAVRRPARSAAAPTSMSCALAGVRDDLFRGRAGSSAPSSVVELPGSAGLAGRAAHRRGDRAPRRGRPSASSAARGGAGATTLRLRAGQVAAADAGTARCSSTATRWAPASTGSSALEPHDGVRWDALAQTTGRLERARPSATRCRVAAASGC